MSDFSFFSLFTAGLACLVPLTSAYTQPTGDAPDGNPIYTPGLNDVVPVGQPYGITWQPTTEGTVSLVLLKGPSTNAVPQYALVEGIDNTGNYWWTPSDDLEPGETGYGIQLIVDATGQYQYSTQFGISNPGWIPKPSHGPYSAQPSSSESAQSRSASSYNHESHGLYGSYGSSSYHAAPTGYLPHPQNSSMVHPTGGYIPHNATHAHPTGHIKTTYHVKPTHKITHEASTNTYAAGPTSAIASAKPSNGASTVATSFVGLVFAAGMAVFAL